MKDLNFKIIQHWSSFLIYFKLSDDQLSQLIELTDTILEDKKRIDYGSQLAGQIETEVHIDPNYLMLGEVGQYLKSCFELYVNRLWLQCWPEDNLTTLNEPELLAKYLKPAGVKIKTAWIVSQRDNEYNPNHIHTACQLSSVLYLKVPEFLPDRKPNTKLDGAIQFMSLGDTIFQKEYSNMFTAKPKAGDFFIFPATQFHQVYPFRTPDGKGERRSMSMNVEFHFDDEDALKSSKTIKDMSTNHVEDIYLKSKNIEYKKQERENSYARAKGIKIPYPEIEEDEK